MLVPAAFHSSHSEWNDGQIPSGLGTVAGCGLRRDLVTPIFLTFVFARRLGAAAFTACVFCILFAPVALTWVF